MASLLSYIRKPQLAGELVKGEVSKLLTGSKRYLPALGLLGGATLLLIGASVLLISGLVEGLSLVIPGWLAQLLVGLGLALVSLGLFMGGKRALAKLAQEPADDEPKAAVAKQ